MLSLLSVKNTPNLGLMGVFLLIALPDIKMFSGMCWLLVLPMSAVWIKHLNGPKKKKSNHLKQYSL